MLSNIGLPGLKLVITALPSLIIGFFTTLVQFVLSPIAFLATYQIF